MAISGRAQQAPILPISTERIAASVGWAKAPTGPREAQPDDRLRAVPMRLHDGKNAWARFALLTLPLAQSGFGSVRIVLIDTV